MAIGGSIEAMIEILIGLLLLPIMAGFIYVVNQDSNLSTYTGIALIMTIIVYVFAFGILLRGLKSLKSK